MITAKKLRAAPTCLMFALLGTLGCGQDAPSPRPTGTMLSYRDPPPTTTATQVGPATASGWGNLTGQFVYDGTPPEPRLLATPKVHPKHPVRDESLLVDPKTNGIANVVVYLTASNTPVHPDYASVAEQPVVVSNSDYRFRPHLSLVLKNQQLVFSNGDPDSHNCYYTPLGGKAVNPLVPPKSQFDYGVGDRVQYIPQTITCSIHPWMRGYILVRPNPYMAVTDEQGRFEIKNLPAGEHEFRVWHERKGYLPAQAGWSRGLFKANIQPGETTDLGEIRVPAKLLNDS